GLEVGLERLLARLGTLELAARRGGDTPKLLVDQFLHAQDLRIEVDDRGMARADQRAKLGALARDLGILRAQLTDGLRQHRLGDRAALGAATAGARDLLVAGARLGGLAARCIEL